VRDAAMVPDPTYKVIPTTLPGVGGYSLYRAAIGTLAASDNLPAPTINCSGG
jgi:hypothetical protein